MSDRKRDWQLRGLYVLLSLEALVGVGLAAVVVTTIVMAFRR